MKYIKGILLAITIALILVGCNPNHEKGFADSETQTTSVSPALLADGLNYPWGVDFVDNPDSDGTGNGSVVGMGNLLVANRGRVGHWADSVVQIDPHTGAVLMFSDRNRVDLHGEPAVDGPMDVAFNGPFVWISNDVSGLGSIAVTDPNPSKAPNGPSGHAGDPVNGPTGTGVFGTDDFGFVVLSVYPESDEDWVSLKSKIEVEFSQPVNPGTITSATFRVDVDYSGMSPYPKDPTGSFRFSDDNRRVEFVYDGYLAESTRYRITLDKDIEDYRGYNLDGDQRSPGPDDFVSYFTTGQGNPMVVWVNPGDGATSVPVDTIVEVGFSEPVRKSSVNSTSFALYDPEGHKISAVVTVHPDLTKARLVPKFPLEVDVTYHVTVSSSVVDLAGNPLDQNPGDYPDPFHSSFSTGVSDQGPPTVVSVTPPDGSAGVSATANITITFSEGIDPSGRDSDYFTLIGPEGLIDGTLSWDSDSLLTFNPARDFREDATYTITVKDVLTDYSGNHLDGDFDGIPGGNFTSSFSTGFEGLYVTSSFPENGATGVSVGSVIYVNFSKAVNPATVTTATFYLFKESSPGSHVSAKVWTNPGNKGATLQPDALLAEDSAYIITVTSDVTDTAGNPLDQVPGLPLDSFSARFTTGGDDKTPPCVVAVQPENNAVNVPVGTMIQVVFSEAILPSSVNTDSFSVTGPTGAVPGDFAFSNSNTTVTFNPSGDLDTSVEYTVNLTTAITDASGNGLDGDCDGNPGPGYTFRFTTGVGSVVINEVVVDPQQDWNDSEGGDGFPFNATPGTGSITSSDEWIEIYNSSSQTLDLTGWTLEMIDSTPEIHTIGEGSGTEVLFPPTATVSNFTPGSYLIIGNPIGSNNNDCYFVLKNAQGSVVDDVEIGDDPEGDGDGDGAPESGEDGNADSIANEAIARVPNGFDSDNDIDDFSKQAATIGSSNGGKSGFGSTRGYSWEQVGNWGISGIVAAGIAPDDPSGQNWLYFACHTSRGAVYGIDFDDGVYYAFSGVDSPVDVEFIPFYENGAPVPGDGYLFVLDPENGNVARVRMRHSGPIGSQSTASVPDVTGKDYLLYFAFPNMSDPVSLAYSRQYDRLYMACRGNGQIIEFTQAGEITEVFDTGLGQNSIGGITVGDMGSGDVVFITYTGGDRVDQDSGPHGALMYFDPHP